MKSLTPPEALVYAAVFAAEKNPERAIEQAHFAIQNLRQVRVRGREDQSKIQTLRAFRDAAGRIPLTQEIALDYRKGMKKTPSPQYSLKVDAVMDRAPFGDLDSGDLCDLALACLDQAGLSAADQEKVRKLVLALAPDVREEEESEEERLALDWEDARDLAESLLVDAYIDAKRGL